MTIRLSPEQERLLAEVVSVGLADTPEDAIDKAVRAFHDNARPPRVGTCPRICPSCC